MTSTHSYVKQAYDPILPGSKDWPVVQLSKNRKQFLEEVIEESVYVINKLTPGENALKEEIEETRFKEKLRIEQNPWNVDPVDEASFWSGIKKQLVKLSTNGEGVNEIQQILKGIITRYAEEIKGNFKPSRYKLTRTMVQFGFKRLLNASRVKGFQSLWSNEINLQDKIRITGEVEQLRALAKKGTVIMVPTHFSNLDSILIGWVIHILGLPPFIYGAGLNLFNIGIFSYFMNSLGAYKVDRRKKNTIYRETLKTYSKMAIIKGCHSLFFPGGTRSRSGKIESKLKLGLLGSAMEAQRHIIESSPTEEFNKIFVVPVVLNYHFVLEAPSLINDYLRTKGQEKYYVESDSFSNSYKIVAFLLKFFTRGSDISVTIGQGLDLFGNKVDMDGVSYDRKGREINIKDYFISDGQIKEDTQREREYTRQLGQVIVDQFHVNNQVFSSHMVAFTAFHILRNKYHHLDLYDLLRLPKEERLIPYSDFKRCFTKLTQELKKLKDQNKVGLASHVTDDLDAVIAHGVGNLGMYHSKRPLVKTKEGDLTSQNLNILYYYHNRLIGYDLEKSI